MPSVGLELMTSGLKGHALRSRLVTGARWRLPWATRWKEETSGQPPGHGAPGGGWGRPQAGQGPLCPRTPMDPER